MTASPKSSDAELKPPELIRGRVGWVRVMKNEIVGTRPEIELEYIIVVETRAKVIIDPDALAREYELSPPGRTREERIQWARARVALRLIADDWIRSYPDIDVGKSTASVDLQILDGWKP